MNENLKVLYGACFSNDNDIKKEARHLVRFFIEYKLLKHSKEIGLQYKAELDENEVFKKKYGELNLYDGDYSLKDVRCLVNDIFDDFINKPDDRVGLAHILKQSGGVSGIQEKCSSFLKRCWADNEQVSDAILDIIFDISIINNLKPTLVEMSVTAKFETLKDHADQLLNLSR